MLLSLLILLILVIYHVDIGWATNTPYTSSSSSSCLALKIALYSRHPDPRYHYILWLKEWFRSIQRQNTHTSNSLLLFPSILMELLERHIDVFEQDLYSTTTFERILDCCSEGIIFTNLNLGIDLQNVEYSITKEQMMLTHILTGLHLSKHNTNKNAKEEADAANIEKALKIRQIRLFEKASTEWTWIWGILKHLDSDALKILRYESVPKDIEGLICQRQLWIRKFYFWLQRQSVDRFYSDKRIMLIWFAINYIRRLIALHYPQDIYRRDEFTKEFVLIADGLIELGQNYASQAVRYSMNDYLEGKSHYYENKKFEEMYFWAIPSCKEEEERDDKSLKEVDETEYKLTWLTNRRGKGVFNLITSPQNLDSNGSSHFLTELLSHIYHLNHN